MAVCAQAGELAQAARAARLRSVPRRGFGEDVVGARAAGGVYTVADGVFIVLLNDWGDRIKRAMFPDGCSPKTIVDGILSARQVLLGGLVAGAVGLIAAVAGGVVLERPALAVVGVVGLLIFVAYSLPPLRLNYRGSGELLEMVGVGAVLPWVAAHAQTGSSLDGNLLYFIGFSLLSLGSALASGLSDEESDRRGGKRTFATLWGNGPVRCAAELSCGLGLLAWVAVAALQGGWAVQVAVAVAVTVGAAALWRAVAVSGQATTGAFGAQKLYKLHLHRAIWWSAGLLGAGIWGAQAWT